MVHFNRIFIEYKFVKVTFFHTSVHGHTRYKSCDTCHLLSFPLVRIRVGEQFFLFSTHCFLLLVAILKGKKVFSLIQNKSSEALVTCVHNLYNGFLPF